MEFFHTSVSAESKQLVQQVLDSGFLNQGKYVKQLEDELEQLGLTNPVSLHSCTDAIHLALELCNVRGKEVCLSSQTFISTGLAVLYAGGKPVFVDVCSKTGNMDPRDLKRKMTENTAACLCIHWGGRPCDLDGIKKVCGNEIPIVEDAAHAFFATYNDKPIGSISDYTCFSLQAIKFVTGADGGILCIKNRYQKDEAVRRRWFGIDKSTMQRRFDGSRITSVDQIGWKYHMNDLTAALVLGNLHTAPERLKIRRSIANLYDFEIRNNRVEKPLIPSTIESSYWLYTVIVENKFGFVRHMEKAGVPVSAVDRGIHRNPVFGWSDPLPGQEQFDETQVSLPCHEALSMDDVRRVIDACNSWKG